MNYRIILLLLLISVSAKSQVSLLSKEVGFVKTEALSLGFQLVQEDTAFTNFNSHLVISTEVLKNGYVYYWVVFSDSCFECDIAMQYWNTNSSKYHLLDAALSSSGTIQRMEYSFKKKDNITIKLEGFVKTSEGSQLYSLLFKKQLLE